MPYSDPEQQRAYQRDRQQKLRMEWLEANGPCAHCGGSGPHQVDHKDPLLKVSHRIWTWSSSRRNAELAKCQVLCTSCHKKKTAKEKERPIPHGTDSGYTGRGCRCLACAEAHRVVKEEWRESRRAAGLKAT